jgi:hypothetical protein
MLQSIRLADPALGVLMTISADDWTDINQRAGQILALRHAWVAADQRMPGFYNLADACVLWRIDTFPGISQLPAKLCGFADVASSALTALQKSIAQMNPGEELPPAMLSQAKTFFGNLTTQTTSLSRSTNIIASEINDFSNDYAQVDAAAAREMGESVQGSVDKVTVAAGKLNGAWRAVADDLSQVMSGELPITSTLLLSLDTDLALRSWTDLHREATAFSAIAPAQQTYLDDGWNIGIRQLQSHSV